MWALQSVMVERQRVFDYIEIEKTHREAVKQTNDTCGIKWQSYPEVQFVLNLNKNENRYTCFLCSCGFYCNNKSY